MKKFIQTLVIGMMAILLGTVLFDVQPIRADGKTTVEVVRNPKSKFTNGRYNEPYQKLRVLLVYLKSDNYCSTVSVGLTDEVKQPHKDIIVVAIVFPKQHSSTVPCPIVGGVNWNASKKSLSTVQLLYKSFEKAANYSHPPDESNTMYFSGKGKTDPKEDRSGEITGLRIKGNSATGSFQFLCWDAERKNFYHVIGSFDAKLNESTSKRHNNSSDHEP